MSRHAFDKIKAGVEHAVAIARGEADPASYRVHIPEEVDVKASGGSLACRNGASFSGQDARAQSC